MVDVSEELATHDRLLSNVGYSLLGAICFDILGIFFPFEVSHNVFVLKVDGGPNFLVNKLQEFIIIFRFGPIEDFQGIRGALIVVGKSNSSTETSAKLFGDIEFAKSCLDFVW